MKVLIIGTQPIYCEGLAAIAGRLEGQPAVTIQVGPDAFAQADAGGYDLILVELNSATTNPDMLAAVRRISSLPLARVVVFSERDTPGFVRDILDFGVKGFIPKSLPSNLALSALQHVDIGGRHIPDSLLSSRPEGFAEAPEAFRGSNVGKLTPRQREVWAELGRGRSNQEIAQVLGISVATAKLHVNAVLQTLGVRNRTEAALLWQRMMATAATE